MIDPEAIRDSVQYTRREVAELLGCSINTVRNRVSAGLLRAHYRNSKRRDAYFVGRELKLYLRRSFL